MGSPIRKSTDIADICSSPWLIAACHVLRRLLMPRHSPCALSSLTELVAKSARLRFRLPAKTAPAPLLLAFLANPLALGFARSRTGDTVPASFATACLRDFLVLYRIMQAILGRSFVYEIVTLSPLRCCPQLKL